MQSSLLDLAGSANFLEGGGDLLGILLGYAFLDGLGSVVYDFLGFLQAEAGLLADDLDDLDLLGADFLQDYVELGLFSSSSTFATSSRSSYSNSSSTSGYGM